METIELYNRVSRMFQSTVEMWGDTMSAMDDMSFSRWTVPDGLRQKFEVKLSPSTAPHNAEETAVKIITNRYPQVTVKPISTHPNDISMANKLEHALHTEIRRADKRSRAGVGQSIGRSAVRYAVVITRVDYIPSMVAERKKAGFNSKRFKSLDRKGKFVFTAINPQNAGFEYDAWGLSAVCTKELMTADEFNSSWPGAIDDGKFISGSEYVTVFDFESYDYRWVFACAGSVDTPPLVDENNTRAEGNTYMNLVGPVPNNKGFLPYTARIAGSDLEVDDAYAIQPLCRPLNDSGSWEILNTTRSALVTETLAHALAPRGIVKGDNGEIIDIDYGDPLKTMYLSVGFSGGR